MNSMITQRFIKCHNLLREEKRVRSSRQFALSLEYLPQSLSEILKGRRDVTLELLRKAVETYKINPVYVICGEGPMFLTDESRQDFRVLTIVTTPDNDERIVHVPVPAQAGYASESSNPTFIEELPTFSLPDYRYKSGTHRSFDVSGDSMEPALFEGDKIICSFVEPYLWETSLKDGQVYVVVTKGDIVVKRIHNRLREAKLLELISDNDYYKTYRIPLAEVREVWAVRTKITPVLPSAKYLKDEIRDLKHTIQQQNTLIGALSEKIEALVQHRK